MNFNLVQACFDPKLTPLLRREIKRELGTLTPLSKGELEEIAAISERIKKGQLPKHFVRKKISPEIGYGIFLHPDAEPLVKEEVIAPYAGEISLVPQYTHDPSSYAFTLIEDILLDKGEQKKWDSGSHFHPKRHYTFKLDAWKKGNFTRFINHSEKPNLAAYTVRIPKNPYGIAPAPIAVVYFVKKKILPGDQLLVCYEQSEKSFWNSEQGKAFAMTPQTFRINTTN